MPWTRLIVGVNRIMPDYQKDLGAYGAYRWGEPLLEEAPVLLGQAQSGCAGAASGRSTLPQTLYKCALCGPPWQNITALRYRPINHKRRVEVRILFAWS